METLIENKTVNIFERKSFDMPSPFYTNESQMFYKNKLVSVEEIIYTKDCADECEEGFNKHFNIYKPTIEYALTFEDQNGNTHSFTCDSKPKRINDLFYYIIENNHITYITHETDKASLKDLIDVYEHEPSVEASKKGLFFVNHHGSISFLLIILLLSTVILTFFGYPLGGYKFFFLGFVGMPVCLVANMFVDIKVNNFYRERNKLISDKKEALLNTFE